MAYRLRILVSFSVSSYMVTLWLQLFSQYISGFPVWLYFSLPYVNTASLLISIKKHMHSIHQFSSKVNKYFCIEINIFYKNRKSNSVDSCNHPQMIKDMSWLKLAFSVWPNLWDVFYQFPFIDTNSSDWSFWIFFLWSRLCMLLKWLIASLGMTDISTLVAFLT